MTPKKFRLMGQTFRLEQAALSEQMWTERHRAHATDSNALTSLGGTEVNVQRIVIREGQGFHQERSTVLHEVIHLIESLAGQLPPADKQEERHAFIAALETGLLDLLRSNPALVSYLTAKE